MFTNPKRSFEPVSPCRFGLSMSGLITNRRECGNYFCGPDARSTAGGTPAIRLAGVLQLSALHLFLAGDAEARPGHGFQPLGVDLLPARNTLAKGPAAG